MGWPHPSLCKGKCPKSLQRSSDKTNKTHQFSYKLQLQNMILIRWLEMGAGETVSSHRCIEAFTERSSVHLLLYLLVVRRAMEGRIWALESTLSAQLAPSSQLKSTMGWLGGQASN